MYVLYLILCLLIALSISETGFFTRERIKEWKWNFCYEIRKL